MQSLLLLTCEILSLDLPCPMDILLKISQAQKGSVGCVETKQKLCCASLLLFVYYVVKETRRMQHGFLATDEDAG